MPQITMTLPEGMTRLSLKNGEELDLRVVVKDGELVATKVLRHSKAEAAAPDYKAKLGQWNRK